MLLGYIKTIALAPLLEHKHSTATKGRWQCLCDNVSTAQEEPGSLNSSLWTARHLPFDNTLDEFFAPAPLARKCYFTRFK